MKHDPLRPRVFSIRHAGESIEDEAPCNPTFPEMASRVELPPMIFVKRAWFERPFHQLTAELAIAALAAIPAIVILTAVAATIWKSIHG